LITIDGDLYDEKSSKKQRVVLQFLDDKTIKIYLEEKLFLETTLDNLVISSRVANTPRIINIKNYTIYSTDNDKIDEILKKHHLKNFFVHKLESNLKYSLFALVFIIFITIFFLTSGSSFLAKKLAYLTPYFVEKKISDATMDTLNSYVLQDSNLSKSKKEAIKKIFSKVTNNNPSYHLYFKRGIGINAFALPSGDIVITDELIQFSDGDSDMIFGVLAHEKAHVVYKHSMQMIIKSSLMTALVTYFTGDVSTLATTLSTTLLTAKYSREFEKEADLYAKELMLKNNISPKHLANFFIKIQEKNKNQSEGYFSSHPSDKERIKELLKEN